MTVVSAWKRSLGALDGSGDSLLPAACLLTWSLPAIVVIGRAPADVAISLVALLFLARSALIRDWQWLSTPWLRVALVLWLYLVAASAFALDPGNAFGRAVPWVRYVLFAAAVQHWVLADRQRRHLMVWTAGIVLAFVAADTMVQFAFGVDVFGLERPFPNRLSGPFRDAVVGTFLVKLIFPVLGAVLGWAVLAKSSSRTVLAIAVIVALAAVIFVTGERIPFLLFALGMCLLFSVLPGVRRPLFVAVVVAAIVVGGLAASSPTVGNRMIHQTVGQMSDFWSTAYGRTYATAFEMWQRHPVFGVGLKNYRIECPSPAYDRFGAEETRCQEHPHNVYLEWLVEAGAIGFLGFLALIGFWGREFARALSRAGLDRFVAVGAVTNVVLFLWPLMSSMSLFSNFNATLFWFAVAWALAATMPRPGRPEARPR